MICYILLFCTLSAITKRSYATQGRNAEWVDKNWDKKCFKIFSQSYNLKKEKRRLGIHCIYKKSVSIFTCSVRTPAQATSINTVVGTMQMSIYLKLLHTSY